MSLWGKRDQANNAPKYKIMDNSPNTGIQLFGTKVVGLDAGEVQASSRATHAGWNKVQYGVGPVVTAAANAAGSGYSNGDVLVLYGGTSNASFTVATNGSGGITGLTKTSGGKGFTNASATSTVVKVANLASNSAGTGATFTFTLGGRAGRICTEVLVAMGTMVGNNSTLAG